MDSELTEIMHLILKSATIWLSAAPGSKAQIAGFILRIHTPYATSVFPPDTPAQPPKDTPHRYQVVRLSIQPIPDTKHARSLAAFGMYAPSYICSPSVSPVIARLTLHTRLPPGAEAFIVTITLFDSGP